MQVMQKDDPTSLTKGANPVTVSADPLTQFAITTFDT